MCVCIASADDSACVDVETDVAGLGLNTGTNAPCLRVAVSTPQAVELCCSFRSTSALQHLVVWRRVVVLMPPRQGAFFAGLVVWDALLWENKVCSTLSLEARLRDTADQFFFSCVESESSLPWSQEACTWPCQPVHTFIPHVLNICRSLRFPSDNSTGSLYAFLISPYACYIPHELDWRDNVWWRVHLRFYIKMATN